MTKQVVLPQNPQRLIQPHPYVVFYRLSLACYQHPQLKLAFTFASYSQGIFG
jgi:hypothetical protein